MGALSHGACDVGVGEEPVLLDVQVVGLDKVDVAVDATALCVYSSAAALCREGPFEKPAKKALLLPYHQPLPLRAPPSAPSSGSTKSASVFFCPAGLSAVSLSSRTAKDV